MDPTSGYSLYNRLPHYATFKMLSISGKQSQICYVFTSFCSIIKNKYFHVYVSVNFEKFLWEYKIEEFHLAVNINFLLEINEIYNIKIVLCSKLPPIEPALSTNHLLLNVLNISTWSFVLTRQFRLLAICELSEVYCEFKCRCTTRVYPCRYFILTVNSRKYFLLFKF